MKPKFLAFPSRLVLTSSAMMAVLAPLNTFAVDFTWKGNTNTDWTAGSNWLLGTAPAYGATLTTDRLFLGSDGVTNATAVYDPAAQIPAAPLVTIFGSTTVSGAGRGIVIGSTTQGPTALTIKSGTLTIRSNASGSGNEPIMANGVNATLLLDGGNLDLTGHPLGFRLCNTGAAADQTSVMTLTNGAFSCGTFDFFSGGTLGTSTVNLDAGGVLAVTRFLKTQGSTASTLNLDGGTLRLRNTQTSPNVFFADLTGITATVEDGGVIVDTNSFSGTIAEPLLHDPALGATLDGGLTKNSAGTLTLSGASTFTGPVTVNAGTALATPSRITLASDTGAGTGEITLAGSYAEIQVNTGRNIANAVTIDDTDFEKTILLPAASGQLFATFSGPVTIDETNIDHFRLRSDDNCFLTLSGKVSGSGGIFKYQPGRLNLTNATNDFTGGVKITHGSVSFVNGGLGNTGSIRMEGTTGVSEVQLRWDPTANEDISSRLVMYDGKTATFNLAEGGSPYAIASVTFASAIGNGTTASMTKTGPGSLTLTQASTYSGGSTLTQGALEFPNNGLGTTGSVTMNGGLLKWATGNTQDLSSRIVMVNGRTASFSTNGNDVTFTSGIGSNTTASLTKTNTAGTLTLTSASTYSGSTTVGGGTLKIGNTTSLGVFGPQTSTAIGTTVNSGATLDLNGVTDINEVITLSGTGVGDNGALVNNSGSPASTTNLISGFTVAATGSGSGFSAVPVVAITGGGGSGATATASLGLTTDSFSVNVPGDRVYTVAPTVTISGGGGSGATAVAVLSGGTTGTVDGILITNAGSGYTTAPTAVISGGTSTGATTTTFTGNATNFTVGGLTLTNAGSGYTSAPSVTFDALPATVVTNFSSVVLAANTSIGGSGNTTINGVVSESGGARALTKVGSGTVTLNGLNTYTGETKVDAGTLAINTDDALEDTAAVRIDSSAILNLGFSGTDTVDRLFIGGVEQVSGTWGSLASSATNKTARITGSGILQVTNGAVPSDPYAVWSGGALFGADANNDGITNGLAFLLGAANVNANATGLLPAATQSGGALTLSFSMRNAAARGTASLQVQHSSDLGITDLWSTPVTVPDADITDPSGIVFDITAGDPLNGVTATIPAAGNAAGGKLFGRLKAQP